MMIEIFTSEEFRSKGLKIARLSDARAIRKEVVDKKKASMKAFGQLQQAIVAEASEALAQGLQMTDFADDTIQVTEQNANDYMVILEGNHRYAAFLELQKEGDNTVEFYFQFALNAKCQISRMVLEMNICTTPWHGKDYVASAIMKVGDRIPALSFIYELTSKGYSLPSASLWATGAKLGSKDIMKVTDNDICPALVNDRDLLARKAIHNSAKSKFTKEDILKGRGIPEWIQIRKSGTPDEEIPGFNDKMKAFFDTLTDEQIKGLQSIQGKRGGETRESLLNKQLTELYTEFCKSKAKELCN